MTIDFGLVPCSVDLDLIKTIASVNLVNGKYYATYNIRVRNTGNCPATGVEVTDDLPFGFTLMSTSSVSQGSFNGLIWNVGTINPGQTATWTLVAQVGNPGIPHVNTAEITNMNEVDIDSTPGNGADTNGSGGIGSQDGDGTQDFGDEDDGDDAVIDVILPLDLLSFSGHYMKGESANLLQWSTLNEISTEHFEVQRSYEESSDFETIGIIDAYGNSVSKLEYDFIDSSLSEVGTYLYRLKIVSSEGETQFSQVISIEVDKISFVDLVVNIYPNPASDKILIETNAEKGDIVTIEIYDITGEKLLLKNVDFNQQIELNTTDLSSGIYLVKTMIKDKVCIKRLSVTR